MSVRSHVFGVRKAREQGTGKSVRGEGKGRGEGLCLVLGREKEGEVCVCAGGGHLGWISRQDKLSQRRAGVCVCVCVDSLGERRSMLEKKT